MFLLVPRLSGFLLVALASLAIGLKLEVRIAGPMMDCDEACCCEPSVEESCCDTEEPLVTMTSACGCGAEGGLHFDGTDQRWIDVEPQAELVSVNHGAWPRTHAAVLLERAPSPESPPPRPCRSS